MSFRYREWVLRSCTDSIEEGKIGLVGRNGCGKTTLLRLLDGQLTPQEGSLQVGGQTYMVDFDLASYKAFWLDDLVDLCAHLQSFDTSRANEVIDLLYLKEYRRTPLGELSKGTAKKVSLLMGFMSTADVLLIDEPYESVDSEANEHVIDMLRGRDGAHVIVSHDVHMLGCCVDATYTIRAFRLEKVA